MKYIKDFDKVYEQLVNEKTSFSQMKKDSKTKEYKEVSQAINNAEEVGDIWNMLDPKMFKFKESEFEDIFHDWWNNISSYDSIADFSRNATWEDAHSLYLHLLPHVSESAVTEAKVENSEILDVIDSIQNLIKNIKTDSSKKGTKLFTVASPLVKELHKLVESVQESFDNVATQVPAETIAVTEGTDLGSWNQGGLKGDKNVLITQFVGPKDIEDFGLGRKCIQINVGKDYVSLNPADIVELKDILKSYKVK